MDTYDEIFYKMALTRIPEPSIPWEKVGHGKWWVGSYRGRLFAKFLSDVYCNPQLGFLRVLCVALAKCTFLLKTKFKWNGFPPWYLDVLDECAPKPRKFTFLGHPFEKPIYRYFQFEYCSDWFIKRVANREKNRLLLSNT